jgi:hypothetical protein
LERENEKLEQLILDLKTEISDQRNQIEDLQIQKEEKIQANIALSERIE